MGRSCKCPGRETKVDRSRFITAIIQRVKSASVTVDGQLISNIGKGLLVFAAIGKDDTAKEVESMASKVLKLKFWDDGQGAKWKHNVQEIEGEVLCGEYQIDAILACLQTGLSIAD